MGFEGKPAGAITALIIAKNEGHNIVDCLESVQWADERIVVDAQSADRTVELAVQAGARVFVRPWPGYGPQKNFGIEQASHEWIMIVDADERVPDALAREIKTALAADVPSDVAAFEVPRRNFFYGRWMQGGGMYPDYQIRLIRRSACRYDDTKLHERLLFQGRILRLANPMDHHTMPTVGHHARKIVAYSTLGAAEKLKRRSRVTAMQIAGHHLGTIAKTYLLRGGWREGVPGVVVAMFAGMFTFLKYAKAWESMAVGDGGEQ
ncbi:MAG: glycosyltransferase family 2 protein [Nitrospiraceae bacterium]